MWRCVAPIVVKTQIRSVFARDMSRFLRERGGEVATAR